jgi:hypothetical protein
MGGSDHPDNLIELSVEEHAEAHKKLYEQCGNEHDRTAWLALSKQIGEEEAHWRAMSIGGKNARARGNPMKDPEVAKRNGEAQKKNKKNIARIASLAAVGGRTNKGKPKSAEHCAAISKAKMGTVVSAATRQKLREAQTGKKASPEALKNIRKAAAKRPRNATGQFI